MDTNVRPLHYAGPGFYIRIDGTGLMVDGPFAHATDARTHVAEHALNPDAYALTFVRDDDCSAYTFLPEGHGSRLGGRP